MAQQSYDQLIVEGIKGLPADSLAEIVDFVYFVRKRILEPESFEEERRYLTLRSELRDLSRQEDEHLEKEFEDYEQLYPRE